MTDQAVVWTARQEGEYWIADVTFRQRQYQLIFAVDSAGRLRNARRSPLALTAEGDAVRLLLDRLRSGQPVDLPQVAEPSPATARLPSVHSDAWRDWKDDGLVMSDVWVDHVDRVNNLDQPTQSLFIAHVRIDGVSEEFELEILPGPTLRERRRPESPSFTPYGFDLERLLIRMSEGKRFAFPFKLEARWPTPPEPVPLSSEEDC